MVRLAPLLVGGAAGLAQQQALMQQLMKSTNVEELMKGLNEQLENSGLKESMAKLEKKAEACTSNAPKCEGDSDEKCQEEQFKHTAECLGQVFQEDVTKDMSEEQKAKFNEKQKMIKEVQDCSNQVAKCEGDSDVKCEELQLKERSKCMMGPFTKDMSEEEKAQFHKQMESAQESLSQFQENFQKVLKCLSEEAPKCDEADEQCQKERMQNQFKCMMEAMTPGMPEEMTKALPELFTKMEKGEEMTKALPDLLAKMGMPEEMLKSMQGLFSGEAIDSVPQEQPSKVEPLEVEKEMMEQPTGMQMA